MKKYITVIIILVVSITVLAQKNIPAAVKNAFAKAYPNTIGVKWDKEKTDEQEANFKNNAIPMSLLYTAKGELLETETEIVVAAFPAKVLAAIY